MRSRSFRLIQSISHSQSDSVQTWRRPRRRTTQAERRYKGSREEECPTSFICWWKTRPVGGRGWLLAECVCACVRMSLRLISFSKLTFADQTGLLVLLLHDWCRFSEEESEELCAPLKSHLWSRCDPSNTFPQRSSGEYSGGWKRTFLEITNWKGVRAKGAAAALWVTRVYLDWVCRPLHTIRGSWHGGFHPGPPGCGSDPFLLQL